MSIGRIVSIVIGSSVLGLMSGPVLAQDAVKIGVSQPLTGAFAASGNYVAQGAKLAEETSTRLAACSARRSG
jgi:hypothetical protein